LHFAPDTAAVLDFAVALVNTAPGASKSGADEIAEPEQLTVLLDENRYSGRRDRDRAELAEVAQARTELRRIWSLERDVMVVELNRILADVHAVPRLERHDGFDWHLHATPPEAPLADRIRVEVALALVDVVRADETGRLRVCEATDCDGLLADLSRNGSKRFCSVRCGNRMNMVAFRDRQG
jgi:hypothetical protein